MQILPGIKAISVSEMSSYALSGTDTSTKPSVIFTGQAKLRAV